MMQKEIKIISSKIIDFGLLSFLGESMLTDIVSMIADIWLKKITQWIKLIDRDYKK